MKPFDEFSRKNPFKFYVDDIINYKSNSSFKLAPQQKFCSSFMGYNTDINGLLMYHTPGTGKTITALLTAESNKAKYIDENNQIKNIPGREIFLNSTATMPVMIVCPKYLIDTHLEEIRGHLSTNPLGTTLEAASGLTVIYFQTEDDDPERNSRTNL